MSDTDIHSCGYYCDRPACIVAQRNELRDKLFSDQAVKTYSGGKPNYTQPIKLQDANESPPESWAQSAQVMGIQKKEWVGLTDDERDEIREQAHYKFDDISNAIEAKLKEKNS